MAIAFRSGSTSTATSGFSAVTSQALALSSSIVSGDLVIVGVAFTPNSGGSSTVGLTGGGVTWTSAGTIPLGGGSGFGAGVNVKVFTAVAGTSTPGATLTGTGSVSGEALLVACSYSGASGVDVFGSGSNTSSAGVTTLAEPSVTTTQSGDWLVAVLFAWTVNAATLTVTNPTDAATSRVTGGATYYEYAGISDSNGTVTVGGHGGGSWSWGSGNNAAPAGALLAIKPAGGSPGGASLTVAQVTTAAQPPRPGAGPVALPVARVNIAAPAPAVGSVHAVALPAAQVAVAAQQPGTGAGPVALPRAQVAVAARAPGIGHTTALPVARVSVAAPLPGIARGWTLALPVAQVAVAAWAPGITGAGRIVTLTPAAAVIQAHAPGLGAASFPEVPLGAMIELDLNGIWTDISSWVDYKKQEISLTRGHADEATTASPAALDLALDNSDARFSDTNPAGPWYGQFGRNTPVRISLPAQATYLRLETDSTGSASCPDATRLHITGDIDLRIDLDLSGVAFRVLAARWLGTALSWMATQGTDGTITFWWTPDGSTVNTLGSTAPLPMGRGCLRVTLDVSNGAGGCTATFYTGPAGGADGSTWTQLGSAVTQSGTTSIFAGTSPVGVGGYGSGFSGGMNGSVFEFELRNGIGGTVVAHPVFTAQTAGAASFTDVPGNTWTLAGTAELSGRDYRAHLEASAFTPSSDPTGITVWQQLNASGILRRIQQGTKPIQSTFRRALPSAVALRGYWPCEDGNDQSGAGGTPGTPTQIASAIAGVPAGTFAANPSFASVSSFLCSYPIIGLNDTRLRFSLEPHATDTANVLRFLLSVPSGGDSADGSILAEFFTTGTVYRTDLIYWTNGSLELIGYNASGSQIFDSGLFSFGVNGTPIWVSVELQQVGGNVQYSIVTLKPGFPTGNTTVPGTVAGTIGQATSVMLGAQGNFSSTGVGQVTVQGQWESLFDFASQLNAYQGEAAGDRFARLCSEEGMPYRIYGPPDSTVAMGAQTPLALMTLLQECANADQGEIYEPRSVLALGYRTRLSKLQQPVAVALDYSLDDLAGSVDSIEDDQYTRNDAVVTRAYTSTGGTGSSSEVVVTTGPLSVQDPPDGVGYYLTSATLNLNLDSQTLDLAGWLTAIGTATGPRFPAVTYDLAKAGIGTLLYSLPAADMGDRLTIASFPAWLPPDGADQLIAQTAETIGEYQYKIKWVLVPGRPYLTAMFDDPVFGHADTDGSTLSASVTSAATTLHVATTTSGSPLWTTAAGDVPFDIIIGGERMTVTAVTGSSSPQTFTVTRSVNGVAVAHAAGAGVDLFYPAIMSV